MHEITEIGLTSSGSAGALADLDIKVTMSVNHARGRVLGSKVADVKRFARFEHTAGEAASCLRSTLAMPSCPVAVLHERESSTTWTISEEKTGNMIGEMSMEQAPGRRNTFCHAERIVLSENAASGQGRAGTRARQKAAWISFGLPRSHR